MEITRTVAQAIERAEKTIALWHRVCGECEAGKKWSEIDNGMRQEAQGDAMPKRVWEAYMRQTMYHNLQSIVLCYRHGPEASNITVTTKDDSNE